MEFTFSSSFTAVPSPVWEGHGGMVLKRMYREGELRWNWLMQVHLGGWSLNWRVCVCVVVFDVNKLIFFQVPWCSCWMLTSPTSTLHISCYCWMYCVCLLREQCIAGFIRQLISHSQLAALTTEMILELYQIPANFQHIQLQPNSYYSAEYWQAE